MRIAIMIILLCIAVIALITAYVDLMLITFPPKNRGKKKHRGGRNV
ncbi:MAG: hypothetical protein ACI4J6_04115 [Oscillospiraceae bacterium]